MKLATCARQVGDSDRGQDHGLATQHIRILRPPAQEAHQLVQGTEGPAPAGLDVLDLTMRVDDCFRKPWLPLTPQPL